MIELQSLHPHCLPVIRCMLDDRLQLQLLLLLILHHMIVDFGAVMEGMLDSQRRAGYVTCVVKFHLQVPETNQKGR